MARLAFIRHSRELGFDVDAIRALLSLQDNPNQSCAAADVIAKARLAEVEGRIVSLTALRQELKRMIEECDYGHEALSLRVAPSKPCWRLATVFSL
jgi:DNA-binding transcriptional MerR regulator